MDLAAHRVAARAATCIWGRPNSACCAICWSIRAGSSTREQLLDAVWGHDVYVEPRTVDVHIRRLRKALNGPEEFDLIRTVRSAGYSLDRGE